MKVKLPPAEGLTGTHLMREATTEFRAVIDLVRNAIGKKLFPLQDDAWVEMEAIYPDRAIVCKDGKKWQFSYTIDDNNQAILGDPVEVKEEFVPIREAVSFIEANTKDGRYLVCVIKAGLSLNNTYYPDAVLREAAPRFERVRVFEKSDNEHLKGEGKDFRQLIGQIVEVRFVEGAGADQGQLQGIFELIEPEGATAVKLREAVSRDMTHLFGFSIDADGSSKNVNKGGRRYREAKSISKVSSVDLIVEPGAGGGVIRMVEAVDQSQQKEQDTMRTRMLEAVKKHNPKKFDGRDEANITDDELETAYREAVASENTNASQVPDLNEVNERIRMIEARSTMRATIAASNLPQPAKDRLLADFEARDRFVEADVTAAITGEREYLGRYAEAGGHVSLNFDEGARAEDRSVRIADMLDAFFDPAHQNHRNAASFKECYIEITGDRRVTGQLRDCDMSKLRESVGASFREAIDTSTFSEVLGDSITRRMMQSYIGMTNLDSWSKVCLKGNASDFRTQRMGRVGGYGNLSIVAQGDPYPDLNTPGDDEATWKVEKRGGVESVTIEAIKNDDVRLISRIPTEMALAAKNTLYEFVFDFFRTNPVTYDGVAMYHATHGNLFTGALSSTEYKAHRLAMQKMTRSGSSKRLATSPAMILVPFELQDTVYDMFVRGTNNDKTFIQSLNPEIITVDYWLDATDWVTLASPNVLPALEIDFLDGREEPELFVQDSPTSGSLFSNDKITYKIKHVYGGNWLVDGEKATTKAVVAG